MRDENFVKDLKADNLNYTLLGIDLAQNSDFTSNLNGQIDKSNITCELNFNGNLVHTTVLNTEGLPTEDEFIKANEPSVLWYKHEKWSEPKYICPKCNEGSMRKETDVVYTSNPPCYKYQCDKCGNTTWHHF